MTRHIVFTRPGIMWTIVSCLMLVFVMVSVPKYALGNELNENLLKNSGFEEITDDMPVHWQAMGGWDDPTFEVSNEAARSGESGVVIQTDQNTNPWIRQNVYDLEEEVTYEATVWLKGNEVGRNGVGVKFEFYSGEPSADTWIEGYGGRLEQVSGDWEQFRFTQVAPPGTKAAQVYFRLFPSGEVYFDDVTFEKIADRPEIDFETDHIFYYPNVTEGKVQAEMYPGDDRYDDKRIDVQIVSENSGEVIAEGHDLQAEQQFSYAFDPSEMVLREPYLVTFDYKNTEGDLLYQDELTIYRWERPLMLQEDGTLIVDGEPFFPMIGYHVRENTYANVNESINTVQGWLVGNDDERMQNYLDHAHENNLKVLVPLYDNMRVKENFDSIQRKVTRFKAHPAVLGWMIMDEPNNHQIPLSELVDAYKLIRTLDEEHPTYMVEAMELYYGDTMKATDILAIDPYPLPQLPITNVSTLTQMAREAVQYEKPVYVILQAFQLPPIWPYLPTTDELRHMAHQSVLEGAQGLGYYSFTDPGWNLTESDLYPGIVDFKRDEWPHISNFVLHGQQIDQYQDDNVRWGLWESGNDLYASILNLTEEAQSASITLPSEGYHVEIMAPEYAQTSTVNNELNVELSKLESVLVKLTSFAWSSDMVELVERFEGEGAFTNFGAARALKVHLISVNHFEQQAEQVKVFKHMKGFKQLLENQWQNAFISKQAYDTLVAGADDIMQQLSESQVEMSVQIIDTKVVAGEFVRVQVQLENTGEDPIEDGTAMIQWPETFDENVTEETVSALNPGETLVTEFEMEIPDHMEKGRYEMSTRLQFSLNGEDMGYTRDSYFDVLPAIETYLQTEQIEAANSGAFPISFTVRNHAADQIAVTFDGVLPEGMAFEVEEPILIDGNQVAEIEGQLHITSDVPDGEYEAKWQIIVDGKPVQDVSINVSLNRNMIVDPGFEVVESWNLRAGKLVEDEVHNGQYAATLTPDSENTWNVISTRERFQIHPGTTYRLTGWVKNASTEGGARIGVREVDANHVTVTYRWKPTNFNSDWTHYELKFTPVSQTETLQVFAILDQHANDQAWFDDFRLEVVE